MKARKKNTWRIVSAREIKNIFFFTQIYTHCSIIVLTLLKLVDIWLLNTPLVGLMFKEGSLLAGGENVRNESFFVFASVKDSCLNTTFLQKSKRCLYIVRNSSKLIPAGKKKKKEKNKN